MKKWNICTNIFNISNIILIIVVVLLYIQDFIMYKELSENLLLIDVLLIGIINFIIIIVNFVQKNIKIGIMYIIILAITFGGMLWSILENYNVLYLAFGILGIILSIINLVFNKRL